MSDKSQNSTQQRPIKTSSRPLAKIKYFAENSSAISPFSSVVIEEPWVMLLDDLHVCFREGSRKTDGYIIKRSEGADKVNCDQAIGMQVSLKE